jgi:hypothetical protein
MVLPGHLAGGYIATSLVLSLSTTPFSHNELTILYFIGILAGEIPDIDLLIFYLEKKYFKNSKRQTHREYVTHLPIFWLSLCTAIFLYGYSIDSAFAMTISLILLAGTFSHFILDSIDFGIQWFKPFSYKKICLFELKEVEGFEKQATRNNVRIGSIHFYWNYLKTAYIRQVTFYAEILVVLVAIYIFFKV